ncbi:MAG: M56 family metallopeptidase [Lachnospiraceae bacterium]|nr:M56 family metallopeptidase [Lachnospiraceae bacterium]
MLTKTIVSTVLILAVMAVRAVFQKKVNPIFIYALWLAVAVRLLMPGMLFFSPVSIMNTNLWRMGSTWLAQEEERQDIEYKQQQYREYYEQKLYEQSSGLIQKEANTGGAEVVEIELKWQWAGTVFGRIKQFAEIVWATGMAVITIIFLWKNLSFYHFLRLSRRKVAKAAAGRRDIPVFIIEDKLASPCLFGLIPAIYLPEKGIYQNKEENFCILEHELTHYRHGDHLWAFLRMICLIINWYNPLVWLGAKLSIQDGELACDAGCIKRLGESKYCFYGEALLAAVTYSRERKKGFKAAAMMNPGKKFMKKRIEFIAREQKYSLFLLAVMMIIMFMAIACTYTGTVHMEAKMKVEYFGIANEAGG